MDLGLFQLAIWHDIALEAQPKNENASDDDDDDDDDDWGLRAKRIGV